jgi:hypothetical protein
MCPKNELKIKKMNFSHIFLHFLDFFLYLDYIFLETTGAIIREIDHRKIQSEQKKLKKCPPSPPALAG